MFQKGGFGGVFKGAWARMPHSCQVITARSGSNVATVMRRALDRSWLLSFTILCQQACIAHAGLQICSGFHAPSAVDPYPWSRLSGPAPCIARLNLGYWGAAGCVEGLQTASPCQVVTVAACAAGESYPEYREKLRGGARGDQDSAEHQGPVGARPLQLWDAARPGTEAAAAPGLAHIPAAPASLSDPCP